jgi:hypothetical protein
VVARSKVRRPRYGIGRSMARDGHRAAIGRRVVRVPLVVTSGDRRLRSGVRSRL